MLYHSLCSFPQASSFQAQVFITHPGTHGIGVGYTPMLDVHTAHVACRFHSLISKLDRKTGVRVGLGVFALV